MVNQEQQLTDYFTMVTKQINLIVCRYVTIVSSQQETEIRKLPEVANVSKANPSATVDSRKSSASRRENAPAAEVFSFARKFDFNSAEKWLS